MATIDYGFMGGFNGKLGTAVGYRWRGKWCVRSLATTVNPRTERQQEHRSMFKQEVQLASRFNWALRETMGEASLERHMTPCNLFVSANQHAFSMKDGMLEVAWEQLVLSDGPVAPVAFGEGTVSEDNTLEINFEKNSAHGRANGYDRVYIFVYSPSAGQGYLAAPVYRRSGRVAAVLPEILSGQEVHIWGMVQDSEGRWSPTVYAGVCSPQSSCLQSNGEPFNDSDGGNDAPTTGNEPATGVVNDVSLAVGMQFDRNHVLWKRE